MPTVSPIAFTSCRQSIVIGIAPHPAEGAEPDGSHLENLILANLLAWRGTRLKSSELFYWRSTVGEEVDFVIETGAVFCLSRSRPRRDRARVEEVEVLEVRSVRRDGEGGFRVEAVWTVSGSVNHFGHVQHRQNRYDAALHIRADEGVWKVSEVEILDERRVL